MAKLISIILLLTAGLLSLPAAAGLQERLLYYPAKASLAEVTGGRLTAWPSAADFRGLLAEPAGHAKGTVVLFHGNAGHAGHREHYAAALAPLGFRVILAEYPAYGPRDGALGEKSFVDDAERTVALAAQRYGAPLLVAGESLGAAVAAQAAARQPDKVTGLLLITPWDKLENVASYHYPWLPVSWLLSDPYDTPTHLAGFRRPVLVLLAEQDNVIPPRFGKALHDGLAGPKRLTVVPRANHNDWVDFIDGAWWRRATNYLLGLPD